MLKIKRGVRLELLSPQMALAAQVVDRAYEEHGIRECWITAGEDGKHAELSWHYLGKALDFRIRNMERAIAEQIAQEVIEALGEGYDVVLEATHLHVEYDPR